MSKILLATGDPSRLADLAQGLTANGDVELAWADSGDDTLAKTAETQPDLVVVDERLGDREGLEVIRQLVMRHPFVNTTAVSSLDEEVFHEASEGLGIMACLPPNPSAEDGRHLLSRLKELQRLIQGV